MIVSPALSGVQGECLGRHRSAGPAQRRNEQHGVMCQCWSWWPGRRGPFGGTGFGARSQRHRGWVGMENLPARADEARAGPVQAGQCVRPPDCCGTL